MVSIPNNTFHCSPTIEQFLQWLQEKHKFHPENELGMTIVYRTGGDETGHGVVTIIDRQIALDGKSPLLKIPHSLLITPNRVRRELKSIFVSNVLAEHVNDEQLLILFIVYHRRLGAASPWYPYLRVLPSSYTKLEWLTHSDRRRLSAVCGVCLDDEVERTVQREVLWPWRALNLALGRSPPNGSVPFYDADAIVDGPSPLPLNTNCSFCDVNVDVNSFITLEEYQYAHATVASRSCWLPLPNGKGVSILVPFLDMFNHSDQVSTLPIVDKLHKTYNLALQPLSSQQQSHLLASSASELFISYGQLDNITLLHRYGFCLENNHHDVLRIPLTVLNDIIKKHISGMESFAGWQPLTSWPVGCAILAECGAGNILSNAHFVFELAYGQQPWDLHIYLRLVAFHAVNRKRLASFFKNRLVQNLIDETPIDTKSHALAADLFRAVLNVAIQERVCTVKAWDCTTASAFGMMMAASYARILNWHLDKFL